MFNTLTLLEVDIPIIKEKPEHSENYEESFEAINAIKVVVNETLLVFFKTPTFRKELDDALFRLVLRPDTQEILKDLIKEAYTEI